MNDKEKQAQMDQHLERVEHLRREHTAIKEQRKALGDEMKDLADQIESELDAIESIRNNLPVQTLLTSDDNE